MNRCTRRSISPSTQFFKRTEGIPSGPGEYEIFSLDAVLRIFKSVMLIILSLPSGEGIKEVALSICLADKRSLEKTLANLAADILQLFRFRYRIVNHFAIKTIYSQIFSMM